MLWAPAKFSLLGSRPKLRTVFQDTLNTFNGGFQGYTTVMVIPAANLGPATGTRVRLTIGVDRIVNVTIKVYMGQQAAAGDAYDFAATPLHVLFNGGELVEPSLSNLGRTTYASDIMTLPEAYDETKTYCIAMAVAGSSLDWGLSNPNTMPGNQDYYKSGDDAATVDKTGYTTDIANRTTGVALIEII